MSLCAKFHAFVPICAIHVLFRPNSPHYINCQCYFHFVCEISCRAYLRGAYTRSKACVKEKVGLSAGGGLYPGGLIGGEIRYADKEQKLNPKAKEGIFVGYDRCSPAYRAYFPATGKVGKYRRVIYFKR